MMLSIYDAIRTISWNTHSCHWQESSSLFCQFCWIYLNSIEISLYPLYPKGYLNLIEISLYPLYFIRLSIMALQIIINVQDDNTKILQSNFTRSASHQVISSHVINQILPIIITGSPPGGLNKTGTQRVLSLVKFDVFRAVISDCDVNVSICMSSPLMKLIYDNTKMKKLSSWLT